jgi:hypothetical protein
MLPSVIRRALSWLRHRFLGGESLIAFGGKDRERHERAAKGGGKRASSKPWISKRRPAGV